MVVRGEAGVGKTSLLDHVAQHAPGCRIVRAAGVQSEIKLPFAGLQQLCAPLLDHLGQLPDRQREALATAFGLSAGAAPDPVIVGPATLSLLSHAAEHVPLICLVDDAQWLDEASALTLACVARRLHTEPVGLVFAAHDTGRDGALTALPELPVRGLDPADARALLDMVLQTPLEATVRDQIIAETHGNPLALLELARRRTPAQLAFGLDRGQREAENVAGRLEQDFLQRIAALPADSRLLLAAAAVEPTGDVSLLWRAADRLEVGPDAAAPAEAAGLIDLGARVTFCHPLVRSAAFRAAGRPELHEVHRALAQSTDPERAPDRRAWHLAASVTGPDESVAVELERSAARARARGGLAATAAFLQRACELTVDPARRAARSLAAAQAHYLSGALEAASALLTSAELDSLDELQHARVAVMAAQIAFASNSDGEAPSLLLAGARQLEPLDAGLARDAHRDALAAALFVGRFGGDLGVVAVAAAALRAPKPDVPGPADLLLDGLATVIADDPSHGAALLKRGLDAVRTQGLSEGDSLRWLWLATHAAHDIWDDESWAVLSTRHVRMAKQAGALTMLPLALSARIELHLYAGELAEAAALVQEVATVAEVTGNRLPPYGALALAARQGREVEALALMRTAREELVPRCEGMGLTLVDHAEAVLHNGLGQYSMAMAAATRGAQHPQELGFASWCLVELVEAAVRSGETAVAEGALERLSWSTRPSGTDWAIGVEARCRALVDQDGNAEDRYQEAIHHLGHSRLRLDLARAHLLYGEWLRREGRRRDARRELRTAHEMCTIMGVDGFAERARVELQATSERVRKRSVDTVGQLTAQEAQIVRLASEGRTNTEIGALLFLSSRTVEWHLRKVFTKLGITSRRELRLVLPDVPAETSSV